jgi:hypothetical protein
MRFWFFSLSLLLSLSTSALAAITPTIGENQTVTAGLPSDNIGFKIVDDTGNPSTGITIKFSLTDSTGELVTNALSEKTADTDDTGQVFTRIETIELVGTYTLTATLATDDTQTASTQLIIIAGSPTTLTVTNGANQIISVGQQSESIQFQLTDAFGNTIKGSAISFALAPPSGSTGELTPIDGVSDNNGQVSTRLEATETQGSYLIIASLTIDSTILASAEVFVIDSIPVLPELGTGQATNADGELLETTAEFSGGLSVNGGAFESELAFPDDLVFVQGMITPDNNHIGQTADIIIMANYTPFSSVEPGLQFYMVDNSGKFVEWDGDIASIVAFRRNIRLSETQIVNIYSGEIGVPGVLDIWFGYRLENGTIVTNINHPLSMTLPQYLPELGLGQALDAEGQLLETTAYFTGGVSVNSTFKDNVQADEPVFIQGLFTPDSDHIGQTADIIVVTSYLLIPTTNDPVEPLVYMLEERGSIVEWDGDIASIVAFESNVTLSETQLVNIYSGQLIAGTLDIWFGYRLENGTLVFNLEYPISTTIERE